jgi:hypothetical protein
VTRRLVTPLLLLALALACSSSTDDETGTPAPTVTLTATPPGIDAGQASTLTWSSTDATGCTASGGWSGARATSGSQNVTPANTTTYALTCTGPGGTTTASATVTVTPAGGVTLTFTATPSFINPGQSSTLSWTSSGATDCTASDGWTGARPTAGSEPVNPAATTVYTLTCGGPAGSATESVTVVVNAPPTGPYAYPLAVGPTSRYLVDQNGTPFFLAGDAAWSLIAEVSNEDADAYLANRRRHGFTLVMVNLIEHAFSANPPANFYGERPFTGANFTTPNEAYFAHADYVIQSAAQKGIVVMLAPLYLGAGCGSEGWCNEVDAATTSALTQWGRYVGNRYRNHDNIIWMIGGDTDPGPVQSKVQAMVDGILASDTRHPFTAHNAPGQMAIEPWNRPAWLNVNNIYTYSTTPYTELLSTYNVAPPIPYFFLETQYENEGNPSAQTLRAQSYWAVLSGAFGHVFGNCPIWHFGSSSGYCTETDWRAELDAVGSTNIQHWQALFTSRRWHTLEPDQSDQVLTGGALTGTSHATAAMASDGSSIIVYLPTARQVTVNPGQLQPGNLNVWWYDPSTGAASQDPGSYTTSVPLTLTPPTAGDWVLVVDAASVGFPPPGT